VACEPFVVVPQMLVEGLETVRGERRRRQANDVAPRRHAETSREGVDVSTSLLDVFARRRCATSFCFTPQTLRKCRSTDAALPKNPMSIPKPTSATACSFEKNAAWISQRLISV